VHVDIMPTLVSLILSEVLSLKVSDMSIMPPFGGAGGPAHSAQTSECYEVGDACEWMDDAVANETPKARLGEMLRTKPAFRHQKLFGFLHDGMS